MKIISKDNILYLEFYSNSKLIRRSLYLSNTKQNIKYVQTKLMPIFIKIYSINNSKVKSKKICYTKRGVANLKEICMQYIISQNYYKQSTHKTVTYSLNRLFDFLPDKEITLYTSIDITNTINFMRKKLSISTINLILGYLFAVFSYAKQKGVIKLIPFSRKIIPRSNPKNKTVLNKKQIKNILKYSEDELQIFLYIGVYTGARSGEIIALCTEDIDLINQKITIDKNQTRFALTTPKSGISRQIPIPNVLVEFLRYRLPKSGKIFSKDYFSIYYKFKTLLNKLNYPSCGLHITRHIYTNTLMSGFVSPQFIANALGHSSLNLVNKTYSHFLFEKTEFKKMQKTLNFEK